MIAETNAPFANRIQLILNPYIGPFIQMGPLGFFDPRRDLEVYVDGELIPVSTFSFDGDNNRYLLFMEKSFNLQGTIQIVHHMPDPPFMCTGLDVGFGIPFGEYFGGSLPVTTFRETIGFGYMFGDYFGGEALNG